MVMPRSEMRMKCNRHLKIDLSSETLTRRPKSGGNNAAARMEYRQTHAIPPLWGAVQARENRLP
jgi:hypothetical protein